MRHEIAGEAGKPILWELRRTAGGVTLCATNQSGVVYHVAYLDDNGLTPVRHLTGLALPIGPDMGIKINPSVTKAV